MDNLILVLSGLAVALAAFFFGGVTQPQWAFCLVLLGATSLTYWLVTRTYKRAPADRWLVMLVAAVVVWTAAQALWFSLARWKSVEYIFTNAAAGLMLVLGRELGWRFRRRIWLAALPLFLVAGLEGALGLFQFMAMREGSGAVESATGTYPNRNHFAGLLEMVLPLAVAGAWAFWRGDRKRRGEAEGSRWAETSGMLALSALLLIGTVISLSRMGFIAALGGLFVLGVLIVGGRGKLYTAGAVGAVLAVVFVVLPTNEFIARFAAIAQTEDISAGSRAQIWRDTLPMIRDHWAAGVGMGAFQAAFYKYKNVAPMATVDYAHNDYLQYLAELGLAGLLLVAGVAGRCMYWMAKGLERSWVVAGGWGAMAAIGLHSLVDFNMYIPANVLVLAWIIGMSTAPAMTEERRAGSE